MMSRPARSWSRIASSVASSCACVEPFRRDAPQLLRAHARRKAAGELLAVDQPVRLGIGADERGRKQRQAAWMFSLPHVHQWCRRAAIETHRQHARDMHRLAAGAVPDLVAARGAVGDDERVRRRPCARPAAATARPWRATRRSCRRHSRRLPAMPQQLDSIVSTSRPAPASARVSTAPIAPNAFWWQWPCSSARLRDRLERQLQAARPRPRAPGIPRTVRHARRAARAPSP